MPNNYEKVHIAGGYFVCKIIGRPEFMAEWLIPHRVLSASDCVVDMLPDWLWALSGTKGNEKKRRTQEKHRENEITGFGVELTRSPELVSWIREHTESNEFGWRSVFFSVKLAREFISQFEVRVEDLALIGVGLHRELVDDFRKEGTPPPEWNLARSGISEMVDRSIPLESGGNH